MNFASVTNRWRKRATLALDFESESIRLLASDKAGEWRQLGEAPLASENFQEDITALATLAKRHSRQAVVELWLPQDQVLNRQLAIDERTSGRRYAAASQLLAQRTQLSEGEISLDLAPTQSGFWATAAAEKIVVEEAVNYAKRWGFTPRRVTTRHADPAFAIGPDFYKSGRDIAVLAAAGVSGTAIAAAAATFMLLPGEEASPPLVSHNGPAKIALAEPGLPNYALGDKAAPKTPQYDTTATPQVPSDIPDPTRVITGASTQTEGDDAAPMAPGVAGLLGDLVQEVRTSVSYAPSSEAPSVAPPAGVSRPNVRKMADFRNLDDSPAPTLGPLAPTPRASMDRSARTSVSHLRGEHSMAMAAIAPPQSLPLVLASWTPFQDHVPAQDSAPALAANPERPTGEAGGDSGIAGADTQGAGQAPIVLAAIDPRAPTPPSGLEVSPEIVEPDGSETKSPQLSALTKEPVEQELRSRFKKSPSTPTRTPPNVEEGRGLAPAPKPKEDVAPTVEAPPVPTIPPVAPVLKPKRDAQPEQDPELAAEEELNKPGPGSVVASPAPRIRPATAPRPAKPAPTVKEPPVEVAEGLAKTVEPDEDAPEAELAPSKFAVAVAPSPRLRPKGIKPRPRAIASTGAKTVAAPKRGKPSGPGVANAATLRKVAPLSETSLLGVFGKSKSRRALIRFSDGRVRRVSAGEVIDGWVVTGIEATSMRMTRGGRTRQLRLVR